MSLTPIEDEVAMIITMLSHPAGFDLDYSGMLHFDKILISRMWP